jgi:hypothetical protein
MVCFVCGRCRRGVVFWMRGRCGRGMMFWVIGRCGALVILQFDIFVSVQWSKY